MRSLLTALEKDGRNIAAQKITLVVKQISWFEWKLREMRVVKIELHCFLVLEI